MSAPLATQATSASSDVSAPSVPLATQATKATITRKTPSFVEMAMSSCGFEMLNSNMSESQCIDLTSSLGFPLKKYSDVKLKSEFKPCKQLDNLYEAFHTQLNELMFNENDPNYGRLDKKKRTQRENSNIVIERIHDVQDFRNKVIKFCAIKLSKTDIMFDHNAKINERYSAVQFYLSNALFEALKVFWNKKWATCRDFNLDDGIYTLSNASAFQELCYVLALILKNEPSVFGKPTYDHKMTYEIPDFIERQAELLKGLEMDLEFK